MTAIETDCAPVNSQSAGLWPDRLPVLRRDAAGAGATDGACVALVVLGVLGGGGVAWLLDLTRRPPRKPDMGRRAPTCVTRHSPAGGSSEFGVPTSGVNHGSSSDNAVFITDRYSTAVPALMGASRARVDGHRLACVFASFRWWRAVHRQVALRWRHQGPEM
jgi:hypothetical protein